VGWEGGGGGAACGCAAGLLPHLQPRLRLLFRRRSSSSPLPSPPGACFQCGFASPLALPPTSHAACTAAAASQLKRYDLVVQLSEEGAGLGARQIRTSSRDTLRDFEQDMALATALAQVGACTAQHSTALHDPACTVCGASLGPQAAGRAAACPPTRLPAQLLLGLSVCGACLRKFGALQGERHTLHC
jgi:hypothetical protein